MAIFPLGCVFSPGVLQSLQILSFCFSMGIVNPPFSLNLLATWNQLQVNFKRGWEAKENSCPLPIPWALGNPGWKENAWLCLALVFYQEQSTAADQLWGTFIAKQPRNDFSASQVRQLLSRGCLDCLDTALNLEELASNVKANSLWCLNVPFMLCHQGTQTCCTCLPDRNSPLIVTRLPIS